MMKERRAHGKLAIALVALAGTVIWADEGKVRAVKFREEDVGTRQAPAFGAQMSATPAFFETGISGTVRRAARCYS
jgi:hypothetical protein